MFDELDVASGLSQWVNGSIALEVLDKSDEEGLLRANFFDVGWDRFPAQSLARLKAMVPEDNLKRAVNRSNQDRLKQAIRLNGLG